MKMGPIMAAHLLMYAKGAVLLLQHPLKAGQHPLSLTEHKEKESE
jgi:hypothetical protein